MADEQAQHLKELLAAISPLEAGDFVDDTSIPDLGISSLEIQIFAARVEKAFQFRFAEGEIGSLFTFGDLLRSVQRHTAS